MDASITTLTVHQQLACEQLAAVAPLVRLAKEVFLAHIALPELHPAQQQEASAREAATALSQMILVLERDLKKTAGL